jgi:Mn2+/Fe2+ NRAMP family transporter
MTWKLMIPIALEVHCTMEETTTTTTIRATTITTTVVVVVVHLFFMTTTIRVDFQRRIEIGVVLVLVLLLLYCTIEEVHLLLSPHNPPHSRRNTVVS